MKTLLPEPCIFALISVSAFAADLEMPIGAICASTFHLDRMLCRRTGQRRMGAKRPQRFRRDCFSDHRLYLGEPKH